MYGKKKRMKHNTVEKDKLYLEWLTGISQLHQYIEKTRQMEQLAQTLIAQVKEDIQDKVPTLQKQFTIILDFYPSIQLLSHGEDQLKVIIWFVPLYVFCLGVVKYNSVKFLFGISYLDRTKQDELAITMKNYCNKNKNNYVLRLAPCLIMNIHFETIQIIFLVTFCTNKYCGLTIQLIKTRL